MVIEAIKKVLKRDHRVILPDLGAIIMDEALSNTIFFNEYIKFDDELVIKQFVELTGKDLETARASVEEYILDIKKTLDKRQSHEIPGLGFIQTDEHNKIILNKHDLMAINNTDQALVLDSPEKEETTVKLSNENDNIEDMDSPDLTTLEDEEPLKETIEEWEDRLEPEDIKEIEDYAGFLDNNDYTPRTEVNETGNSTAREKDEITPLSEDFDTVLEEEEHESDSREDGVKSGTEEENSFGSIDFEEEDEAPFVDEENEGSQKKVGWIVSISLVLVAAVGASLWYFYLRPASADTPEILTQRSTGTLTGSPSEVEGVAAVADDEAYSEGFDDKEPTQEEPTEIIEKENTSSELQPTETPIKEVEEKVTSSPAESEEGEIPQSRSGTFSIILGGFKVEGNADAYVKKLNEKGYNVSKYTRGTSLFYVGYPNIPTKVEAKRKLEAIKKVASSAWIKKEQ